MLNIRSPSTRWRRQERHADREPDAATHRGGATERRIKGRVQTRRETVVDVNGRSRGDEADPQREESEEARQLRWSRHDGVSSLEGRHRRRGAGRTGGRPRGGNANIQYNTIQNNAMQCNAMQCNAKQCNAIQYNTIQYNEMQCNTIRHRNFFFFYKITLQQQCAPNIGIVV